METKMLLSKSITRKQEDFSKMLEKMVDSMNKLNSMRGKPLEEQKTKTIVMNLCWRGTWDPHLPMKMFEQELRGKEVVEEVGEEGERVGGMYLVAMEG